MVRIMRILMLLLLIILSINIRIVTSDNNNVDESSSTQTKSENKSENKSEIDMKDVGLRVKKRHDQGKSIALQMLRASASDFCDWRTQPFAYLKGEICGGHYKVLGLDRKQGKFDKADIKKAYRQKSLHVHPDKNPAAEAKTAFEALQRAFECLYDDDTAASYNNHLMDLEETIHLQRQNLKKTIIRTAQDAAGTAYYYTILAADRVYVASMDVWEWLGQWEVELLGGYHKVAQYVTLGMLLFTPGRILLQIHAVAYGLLKLNRELIRDRTFD